MALIKCKECGHEVSSKASACPNCGCPLFHKAKDFTIIKKVLYSSVIIILTIGLLYYVVGKTSNDVIVNQDFANKIHKYEVIGEYGEGYAAVRSKDKWGFIDTKGEEVIACTLNADYAGCFSEGMACLFKDSTFYFINRKGKILFHVKSGNNYSIGEKLYNNVMLRLPQFHNGICKVPYMESSYGGACKVLQLDTMGKVVKEEKANSDEVFSLLSATETDFSQFMENGLIGLKDKKGNVIVPAKYSTISTNVSNGVFLAVINEEGDGRIYCPRKTKGEDNTFYGYVDLHGNETFYQSEYSLVASAINERERIVRGNIEEAIGNERKIAQQIDEQKKKRDNAKAIQWLYGTWQINIGGGAYLKAIINDSQIIEIMFLPSRGEIRNVRSYSIDGDRLLTDKTKYRIDRMNKRLLGDDGKPFAKLTASNNDKQNRNNTFSGSSYSFFNDASVIEYLSKRTFSNGRNTVKITFNGIYVNGNYVAGIPKVERYEPYKALIRASAINGGIFRCFVDPVGNRLIDQDGDMYYLK